MPDDGAARILVVNADDYGLTPGVCAGIHHGHRDGIITSTSVLTVAPAFDGHADTLRDSGLPAGLHLCVVGEDPPLLGASEIPSLVDTQGRFPPSWRQFLGAAARGAIDPADLDREFSAQHELLTSRGIEPTHLDSHQNLHLWPSVAGAVLRLARRERIEVVRVTRSRRLGPIQLGVRALAGATARRARRAGLVVPDVAAGIDEAGTVDEKVLVGMISALGRGRGHADLTVHPGRELDPDRDRYRWGYSWPTELRAVCSTEARTAVERSGFTLGSFADIIELERRGSTH